MIIDPQTLDLEGRIQFLLDIEAIKRLKYKYFRCYDTANVEEIADCFTDDVTMTVKGGVYGFELSGKEAYLKMVREGAHAEMITLHNGHHPEIDILGPDEAKGTWYLQDNVLEFRRKMHITGTALYRDRYLRTPAGWRIKATSFERIFEINETLDERPNVTAHYLGTHGHRMPPGELPPYPKDR